MVVYILYLYLHEYPSTWSHFVFLSSCKILQQLRVIKMNAYKEIKIGSEHIGSALLSVDKLPHNLVCLFLFRKSSLSVVNSVPRLPTEITVMWAEDCTFFWNILNPQAALRPLGKQMVLQEDLVEAGDMEKDKAKNEIDEIMMRAFV